MATVTISLPEPMADWVEKQVGEGVYPSLNDYFRTLVDRDRAGLRDEEGSGDDRQNTIEELRQIVVDARASGISGKSMMDIAEEAKAVVRGRGRLRDWLSHLQPSPVRSEAHSHLRT